MTQTRRVDKQKAERISRKYVEGIRQSNPAPSGELRVSKEDYDKLEKTLTRKILEVIE